MLEQQKDARWGGWMDASLAYWTADWKVYWYKQYDKQTQRERETRVRIRISCSDVITKMEVSMIDMVVFYSNYFLSILTKKQCYYLVGWLLGLDVGCEDGCDVGWTVGSGVGLLVGWLDGTLLQTAYKQATQWWRQTERKGEVRVRIECSDVVTTMEVSMIAVDVFCSNYLLLVLSTVNASY